MDEAQGHPAGDKLPLSYRHTGEPATGAVVGVEKIRIVATDGVVQEHVYIAARCGQPLKGAHAQMAFGHAG